MVRFSRRLISSLLIVIALFAATRGLIRSLPGDPLETLIAESGTSLPEKALREEFHLDEPFWSALAKDARKAVHGDFGISIATRQPIGPLLVRRFLKTFELTIVAFALMSILSLVIGLSAADVSSAFGKRADRFCSTYSAIVTAMPTPWIGPLLMVVFCVWIPIFPLGDHVILPALTLALSFAGLWSRLIRERVRETLHRGASVGARARGVSEWKILLKYGFAPCSGALLAFLGTQLGALLAGAFVTEMVFSWPGLGDLLISAVLRRDYPVVEAGVFVGSLTALLGTALGDWVQTRVDPRLRELS